MSMSVREEILEILRDHGAKELASKKHRKFRLPDGRNFIIARSPSDYRADDNALGDLRRLLGIRRTSPDEREPVQQRDVKEEQRRLAMREARHKTQAKPFLAGLTPVDITPVPLTLPEQIRPTLPEAEEEASYRPRWRKTYQRTPVAPVRSYDQQSIERLNQVRDLGGDEAVQEYLNQHQHETTNLEEAVTVEALDNAISQAEQQISALQTFIVSTRAYRNALRGVAPMLAGVKVSGTSTPTPKRAYNTSGKKRGRRVSQDSTRSVVAEILGTVPSARGVDIIKMYALKTGASVDQALSQRVYAALSQSAKGDNPRLRRLDDGTYSLNPTWQGQTESFQQQPADLEYVASV